VTDLLLLAVLVGYAFSGYRQGLVVGVLSLGGFVGGSVLAMWVVPSLAAGLPPGVQRSMIVLGSVLVMAWLGQFIGSMAGVRLRDGLFEQAAGAKIDQALGAVAGVVAVALVMWFVGGALRGGPSPQLARAVADSRVLTVIDRVMPDRLIGLANTFRGVVAGTSFPRVFAGVGREDITPVAPPDAERLHHRGGAVYFRRKLVVGKAPDLIDLGRDPDQGLLPAPLREVPVDRVVAQVGLAADEPLRERRPRVIEHLRERLVPVDEPGFLAPEAFSVGDRAPVELLV